ncbi:8120_t:CDS:2, partial [Gigaspora rosea]
ESLTLAGVWVIGEHGDILIKGGNFEEEELVKEVTESDVIDLLESILAGPYANQVTREYVLTALMKLTSRFTSISSIQRIQAFIEKYNTSIEVEVQQRAVEYSNLFKFESIRPAVLERMPIPEVKEEVVRPTEDTGSLLDDIGPATATTSAPQNAKNDIMNLFGSGSLLDDIDPVTATTAAPLNAKNDIMNLFSSGPTTPTTAPVAPTQNAQQTNALDSLGLLGLGDQYVAYNKNGFKVSLNPSKDPNNSNILNIEVTFHNVGVGVTVQNLLFQAAVPK